MVMEWLHQGCDGDLPADFSILAITIFLSEFVLKSASKNVFSLWRRDQVLARHFPLPLRLALWSFATSRCKSY